MPATKIIFKRSSILGKRPSEVNLEPGELALNTNSNDPGIYFETNDGSVVKAGPTAFLPEAPTTTPAKGELWVDSDTKSLSIGSGDQGWEKVASPFLGGTNGLTVFVAPEYSGASDSLSNDGQTVPFVTVNRAIIEVTKYIIRDTLNGTAIGNNRYLIVLAPGQHCVINRPGTSVADFSVDFTNKFTEVTSESLRQFNPATVGGLVLPRGVSIIGLDLKKCEVHPTYVPKYDHPALNPGYRQNLNGPVYGSEPASSIFKWSGNTYLSNFTGLDKIESNTVVKVREQDGTKYAIFRSVRPHGLGYNDFVNVVFAETLNQVGSSFIEGAYYAYPVNNFEYLLSPESWDNALTNPVLYSSFSGTLNISNGDSPKLTVSNIYPYYVPQDGINYELSGYSHHRLSVVKNVSITELNEFYTKVQKAFSTFFGNQVKIDIASAPEVDIVASTRDPYPNNLVTNSTDNSSPYQNTVNHRSDYGMANGDYDGDLVSGFKSVIINSSTAVILQKDPAAYEIYSTASQNWVQLTEFTRRAISEDLPITAIPRSDQLKNLNDASIPNIRYYYDTIKVLDETSGTLKSTGLPDPDKDFRHFGFRMSGKNSYMQAQSTYTIGAAVAVWARKGAIISLTNATTNFGSVAFESDGFAGIGTLGGADEVDKGFVQSGVVRPLALSENSVVSDRQKRILPLGSRVIYVGRDPEDPAVQLLYLQRPINAASILPFSLKPGSAVYVTEGDCEYRGFFVTNGTPTFILSGSNLQNPYAPGGGVLRLRSSDSTVVDTPSGTRESTLSVPFIRRFIDPRTVEEKSYGFYIQSTNPTSKAPQVGSVLRLNQTGQNLSDTIKRNFQFDPGQYGGVAQTFTVDLVQTEQYSASPNFNYKVSDFLQDTNYAVYTSVTDAAFPWIQTLPSDPGNLDSAPRVVNHPQGSYITYFNKNYYAAENSSWEGLYYDTTFNELNGPIKVSPDKKDSAFVPSSCLQRTELVTESWQGYVPDPYYNYYTSKVPSQYAENLSYMRGAVTPYSQLDTQFQVDDDDGSPDMGLIFKRVPVDASNTVLVSESVAYQSAVTPTTQFSANPTFGRPEIISINLLAVQQVVSPKEGVSVLQLSNPDLNAVEYVRVISLNSNNVLAIRNYYPEYAQGQIPQQWPAGTTAKVCLRSGFPEPSVYDPDWSISKSTMFRYYQLMGYAPKLISPYLKPQSPGERVLSNVSIPLSPISGYANQTAAWPVEFNQPSTIVANTHTWQYAGYLDYSRGLPKFQVNKISRKLSYDFLSSSLWGGRLTVTGCDEQGEVVFQGPVKEAITGRFYNADTPLSRAADRQTYATPEPVVLPNPVLVYSADDISGQFDGTSTVFPLSRGGYSIPLSQLSTFSVFVFLGGAVQKPGEAYTVQTEQPGFDAPQIVFSEAPPKGASCDVRIVTTDDEQDTLEVVPFSLDTEFDGIKTSFTILPSDPATNEFNTFVFLGGVEQNPSGVNQTAAAYSIEESGGFKILSFIGGAPLPGTNLDIRGVLSGTRYREAGVDTVYITSTDDIAPLFNNTLRTFSLEVGGVGVDPAKVNAQNMFVSLGGVMQIPIAQEGEPKAGLTYSVKVNEFSKKVEITFASPPPAGATCNIRVITSENFITCPIPSEITNTVLNDGPGIGVNKDNQIISIDQGII